MDSIETSANGAPAPSSTAPPAPQGPAPSELQQAFDRKVRDLESGFHAKVREVNSVAQALQQQQAAFAEQQRMWAAQQQAPTSTRAQRLSEMLDPIVGERMDAGGKSVLDLIGNHVAETVDSRYSPLTEKLSAYEKKIAEMESKLTQREQRDEQARIQREAQALQQKYGEDAVRDHAQQIGQALQAIPGMSLEAAFRIAAPQVFEDHVRRQVETEFNKRRETLGYDAGLEGMFPEPSQTPNPSYAPGEDMMSSAMAALGAGRIRTEAIRDSIAQ